MRLFRPGDHALPAAFSIGGAMVLLACSGVPSPPAEPEPDGFADVSFVGLRIEPPEATLSAGDEHRFRAFGIGPAGSTTEVEATWTATGGSVDMDGLYVAGAEPGSFRVTASLVGGLADTAEISITSARSPPGASATCGEPADPWIWCDDFEEDRLSRYFEYNAAGGSFVRLEGVGRDSSTGMRARFDRGAASAGALHLAFGRTPDPYFEPVDKGTSDHREIYWRIYVRNQADWTGGGGDKLSRAMVFASPDWAQAMIAHVWSGSSAPDWNHLVLDPASGTDREGVLQTTKYNDFANLRWLGADRGETPLFGPSHVGDWHCVEAHVRLNEPGVSDGVFELWIDGEKDAERTALDWLGAYDDFGINSVFIENYWNDGSPRSQERYLDDFVVSTRRIGC